MPDWGRIGAGVMTGGLSELGQQHPFGMGSNPFERGSEYAGVDPTGDIAGQSGAAARFATQGEQGYGAMTGEMNQDRQYLRGLSRGQNSVSAEQLRQGLQQQQAAQMSMAAGARPGSAPMAARTAMMGMSRAGSAMSGQQALAGIQERNMAAQQLAALNQAQRQQDMQVALGSRQTGLEGFSGIEQNRTQRYGVDMGVPSQGERVLGAAGGLMSLAAMKSDRRAKTDIKDGSKGADKLIKGLRAYSYRYKDSKDGEGEYLGPMAQDIERTGVKGVVMDTPKGKMVHGGRLAAALAAALPGLDKRLSKLEGSK